MPVVDKDEAEEMGEDSSEDSNDSKISSSVEKFEKILEKRKKMLEEEQSSASEEKAPEEEPEEGTEGEGSEEEGGDEEMAEEDEDAMDMQAILDAKPAERPLPEPITPPKISTPGVFDPQEVLRHLDSLAKEQVRIANILTSMISDFEEERRKTAILDERLNSLLRKDEKQESLLAAVDNKLSQVLEREKAEQERIERLSQLRRLEEDELSDSLTELSEIYEMTQKKLAVAREDMTLVKDKLKHLLEGQKIDEERKLIGLTRAHELTQQRLEALEDLVKLKDPSEKEKALILMLKKGHEELERELEGEIAGDPVKLAALLRREKAKGALPPGAAGAKPITCPVCHTKFEVTSQERPLKIQCPSCGAVGILKK